jgi:hypothetical protein
LTDAPDDGIVVIGSGAKTERSEKLGNAGSDGLVTMFADALRLGDERLDRRIAEVSERFDRRLTEESAKLRLEMANLKFDLLKWNFLFWIGQVAVLVSVLSWMLRGVR